ncbi:IucA/IucC family C-terminal-domain containing protein [Peribacillus alkalitolerans]|uniref:IucA/IucC family C-terminal-domain containing protein n=1 Tax=Peribacillus alkalitolerans TaxID=1550385 RepID=UPI0013D335E7|nr:IucA/IucC family C-terminal-domain containing protein [Peribacillus alkalitolerans]
MMLSEQEKSLLTKFRLSTNSDFKNTESYLNSTSLIESLGANLNEIKVKIGTADDKVAASLLIKRYAFLSVIGLVMMSAFNKKLDYSADNVALVDHVDKGLWLPQFAFHSMKMQDISEHREEWRRIIVQELFAEHIFELIDVLSKSTKISKLILWENVAVYLFWIYEVLQDMYKESPIKERLSEDFLFILSEDAAVLFGKYHSNPINRYFYKKTNVKLDEEPIRVRMTCCLSNRLSNKGSCKTCPQTCKELIKSTPI